jgi:hypothetical protein
MAKAKWFENRLNGSGGAVPKHAAFDPASQKRLGFRLRSPLPSVEEPCPLSLQTALELLRLRPENFSSLRVFEPLSRSFLT